MNYIDKIVWDIVLLKDILIKKQALESFCQN